MNVLGSLEPIVASANLNRLAHRPIPSESNLLAAFSPNPKISSPVGGAGAILLSRLVYLGWKFPIVKLTESDEKYLFDLEVRIKLRQENALKKVVDAIAVYPAPAILQRPTLLQSIMDLFNSPYSNIDYGTFFSISRFFRRLPSLSFPGIV
jgi:hypothetical protein